METDWLIDVGDLNSQKANANYWQIGCTHALSLSKGDSQTLLVSGLTFDWLAMTVNTTVHGRKSVCWRVTGSACVLPKLSYANEQTYGHALYKTVISAKCIDY